MKLRAWNELSLKQILFEPLYNEWCPDHKNLFNSEDWLQYNDFLKSIQSNRKEKKGP